MELNKSLWLFESKLGLPCMKSHQLCGFIFTARARPVTVHNMFLYLRKPTLVLGSNIFTPYIEIWSSTLGVFCPSDFLMCLWNWGSKSDSAHAVEVHTIKGKANRAGGVHHFLQAAGEQQSIRWNEVFKHVSRAMRWPAESPKLDINWAKEISPRKRTSLICPLKIPWTTDCSISVS